MGRCNRPLSLRERSKKTTRAAFTLLELMLALALSVLVAGLIANLVGMYSTAFATRGEDIRRVALARSVLNMIAEDLRSNVSEQKFDTSVLQQMLTGQAAGGGASTGQAAAGGQSNTTLPNTPTGPNTQSQTAQSPTGQGQAGQSQAGQTGQTGTDTSATDAQNATTTTALPLGIYGSATNLTMDISRLPRPDEYIALQTAMLNGTLNDVPGDIKNVAYWVQLPTNMGVTDKMNAITSTPTASGNASGLVRRVLDRAVLAHAEELGQSDQLNRTGDLIAPEILSLQFMYFDGTQWLTTWDSSTQGLPWLVEISVAIQSKSGEKGGRVLPGISLTSMPTDQRAQYGIEVYTLTVTIPGAQLQANATDTTGTGTGTDSGMSSVGL